MRAFLWDVLLLAIGRPVNLYNKKDGWGWRPAEEWSCYPVNVFLFWFFIATALWKAR